MKKNIYLAAILCGLAGVFSSCSDDNKEEGTKTGGDSQYKPVVYLGDTDVKTVSIEDFDKDVVFTTSVYRKGSNVSSEAVDAVLAIMTEDEMYYYNKVYGSSYAILPADCYEYQKEYVFSGNEEAQKVEITLKKEILYLDKSQKYALPLRLTSKSGAVDEDWETLIVATNVVVPEIRLGKSGKQDPIELQFVDPDDIVSVDIPILMNSENKGWDFSAELETDSKILNTLISRCPSDGTEYSLLGTDYYEMESKIDFSGNETENTLSVKIKKGDLESGNYLLPIVLKGVTNMPFVYSKDICFIHVYLKDSFDPIDIKGKVTTNGDTKEGGNGIGNVIDSDPGTAWQSPWWSGYWPTGDVTCDPEYGIYIDVNVPITKGMQLKITTKAKNNYPTLWRVYGKQEGSGEWMMLNEYSDTFSKTPISFTTEKFYGNYSAVRVAFIKTINGPADLRNITISGGYCKNVSISELEMFGF